MLLSKISTQYLSTLLKVAIFGLLAFHIVPLLISAFYTQPTSVDDYCFADTVKKFGMFEAMKMYYTQSSGRYFTIFLVHGVNPLSYGSQFNVGFKFLPLIFFVTMICAVKMLLKQIFASQKWLLVTSLLFMTIFVSQMPSIAEGLYWFASAVVHWLGFVLFFVNCANLLKATIQKDYSIKDSVLSTFVIILSAGTSEPAFLTFVIICFAVALFNLIKYRFVNKNVLWLIGVSLIGVALIKFSSANIGRQNVAFSELDWKLLIQVLLEIVTFAKWFVSLYLGVAVLLYIFFLGNEIKRNGLFNLPVWYVLLVSCGIIYFNHFIGVIGVGGSSPRIWNGIYLYFISGLFFIVSVLWHKYGVELKINNWSKVGLIAVALGVSLRTNTLEVYRDIKHGTFEKYNVEIQHRITMLESEKDGLILPLIENKPFSLFFQDMNYNPHGLWSKCLGDYYEKQKVTFEEN